MSGTRGVAWRREEVLDLLDIWGSRKTQAALRQSHRNRDVYEEVSKALNERGHARTADECHTKTKGMRQAYKKVLAHNSKSGNSPTTCPYYEELQEILRGDPSVKRRRISQSTSRDGGIDSQPSTVTLELRAITSEEEYDLLQAENSINTRHHVDADAEGAPVVIPPDVAIEDFAEDIQHDNNTDVFDSEPDAQPIPVEHLDNTEQMQVRDPNSIPPGAALSDLSPPSRIALRDLRRRKTNSINKVGELLIKQSLWDTRALMEASLRENDRLISVLQSAQDKEENSTQAVLCMLRETAGAIAEVSKTIAQSRQGVNTSQQGFPIRDREIHGKQHTNISHQPFMSTFDVSFEDDFYHYDNNTDSDDCQSVVGSFVSQGRCHNDSYPRQDFCIVRGYSNKSHPQYSHNKGLGARYTSHVPPNPLLQTERINATCRAVSEDEPNTPPHRNAPNPVLHTKIIDDIFREELDEETKTPTHLNAKKSLVEYSDDSPDYVGTHLWGQTQEKEDGQGVSCRHIPFLSAAKHTHTGHVKLTRRELCFEGQDDITKEVQSKLSASCNDNDSGEEAESESLLSCRNRNRHLGLSRDVALHRMSKPLSHNFKSSLVDGHGKVVLEKQLRSPKAITKTIHRSDTSIKKQNENDHVKPPIRNLSSGKDEPIGNKSVHCSSQQESNNVFIRAKRVCNPPRKFSPSE